jgi:Leucine-rich repeat (LRR) protein
MLSFHPHLLAGCRHTDRAALLSLYEALGGADWKRNTNWSPDADPCNAATRFHGVGVRDPCDRWRDGEDCAVGRVTSLYLEDNQLQGDLGNWSAIGALSNLSFASLSWNEMEGTLPTELGQVRNLEVLDMAHNRISGTIPVEIATPSGLVGDSALREVRLSHNSLSGVLPSLLFSDHVALEALDVRSNELSGTVPWTALGPAMDTIHMAQTRVSGTLPPIISALTKLTVLDTTGGGISGTLPTQLGDLARLNALRLSGNALSGSIPDEIGKLVTLRSLLLADNALTGPLPQTLGELQSLETLDVFNNSMGGEVPPGISALANLQYLYLDHEHLRPLRQRYCRQRLPNLGKYNYRIVRDDYKQMVAMECDQMHSTAFTFNSLQQSGSYDT